MTSSWISVESTSITISRIARRSRPARCTATSTPLSTATWASAFRSDAGSAPETSSSTQVTGSLASRVIRSMLAPLAAIRPATAATALGSSGLPSTVTCSLPRTRRERARDRRLRRAGGDLRLEAEVGRQVGDRAVDRGQVGRLASQPTRTPSTSRPLIVTCSMSATLSGKRARAPNSREVTPGRSRPVSVIRSVVRD